MRGCVVVCVHGQPSHTCFAAPVLPHPFFVRFRVADAVISGQSARSTKTNLRLRRLRIISFTTVTFHVIAILVFSASSEMSMMSFFGASFSIATLVLLHRLSSLLSPLSAYGGGDNLHVTLVRNTLRTIVRLMTGFAALLVLVTLCLRFTDIELFLLLTVFGTYIHTMIAWVLFKYARATCGGVRVGIVQPAANGIVQPAANAIAQPAAKGAVQSESRSSSMVHTSQLNIDSASSWIEDEVDVRHHMASPRSIHE